MSKQKIREWLKKNYPDMVRRNENVEFVSNAIYQYTQDHSADLDAELEDIINSRDYFEDKATELANDIGEYLGYEVGEHSSSNNPIQNAIDTLYCIKNKIGDYADTQDQSGWVSVENAINDQCFRDAEILQCYGFSGENEHDPYEKDFDMGSFDEKRGFTAFALCNGHVTHVKLILPPTEEA